jgi:hypothetical protein
VSGEVAEQLTEYKHVMIRNHTATHWRHQPLGAEYLCTVEAMYYFMQARAGKQTKAAPENEGSVTELEGAVEACSLDNSPGSTYDDLLFFYAHQHNRVLRKYASAQQGGQPPPDSNPYATQPIRALKSWHPTQHRSILGKE